MLAKISPWGLAAFSLASFGLLCASLVGIRPLTIALSGLGLLMIVPGLLAGQRQGQSGSKAWMAVGGALSAVVLLLALFVPGVLNNSWVRKDKLPQEDPNRQMLVSVDKPMEPGRPLAEGAWADAPAEGIRQYDMFARLETVKIGRLPEKGSVSLLLVQFLVTQIKIEQQKAVFQGFDKHRPILTDDSGRSFTFLGARPRKPFHNVFDNKNLNEDQWLIYELPEGGSAPPKIESLKLEVSAAAWSRQGVFRFRVKTIELEEAPDLPKLIALYKDVLKKKSRPPDVALGRKTFVKHCIECHSLFGVGGKVGPELTDLKLPDGSLKRKDLDFLVTNIVDPSLEIAKEFRPFLVTTTSGQVIIGIIKEQTDKVLTLQTASAKTVDVKNEDIEEKRESKTSLMPTELLKPMDDHEVRSLFAYLSGPAQAPLLASHENFVYFFNGTDLKYWKNPGNLWKLDKSEVLPPGPQAGKPALLISDLLLADDFHVSLQFHPGKDGRGAILIQDEDSLDLSPIGLRIEAAAGEALALVDRNGERHSAPSGPGGGTVLPDTWNLLEIIMTGKNLQVRLNKKDVLALDDSKDLVRRCITLEGPAAGIPEGSQIIRIRNLDLRLLSANKRNP